MKVILSPDSFKGSLSASEAALCMARGVKAVFPAWEAVCIPIADGGEGTAETIAAAAGGHMVALTVTGPDGTPVHAEYALLPDGTAVIEMASASGLTLTPQRKPRTATTYGTGELMRAALDEGCRRFIIGLGGSATNDGGAGMAQALGARLLDAAGQELPFGGEALLRLEAVDTAGMDSRLADCRVLVASDVTNPLTGENGASAIYGPQKGATPEDVAVLDAALARYAEMLRRALGVDVEPLPGSGAAGGLGGGLIAFCGAELCSGIDLVLDYCGFDEQLQNAGLVLTGEGRIDGSSLQGKVIGGLLKRTRAAGVPLAALTGGIGGGEDLLLAEGLAALMPIVDGPMDIEEAIARAPELLERAVRRLMLQVKLGTSLA